MKPSGKLSRELEKADSNYQLTGNLSEEDAPGQKPRVASGGQTKEKQIEAAGLSIPTAQELASPSEQAAPADTENYYEETRQYVKAQLERSRVIKKAAGEN